MGEVDDAVDLECKCGYFGPAFTTHYPDEHQILAECPCCEVRYLMTYEVRERGGRHE